MSESRIPPQSMLFGFRCLMNAQRGFTQPACKIEMDDEGVPLDPVYCILLALNEACRTLRQGCFYHLPLRQDINKGHPCDLVFTNEDWSDFGCKTWDAMDWKQRLKLCDSELEIVGSDSVIPICARMIGCDADPASKAGTQAYSRPIEDVSTFLVHYDSKGYSPFVCMSRAAEYESICERFPTPGDISETFVRRSDIGGILQQATDTLCEIRDRDVALRAAVLVRDGRLQTSCDVVCRLLNVWQERDPTILEDQAHFGPVKLLWSELEARVNTDRADRDIEQMPFWPKAEGQT